MTNFLEMVNQNGGPGVNPAHSNNKSESDFKNHTPDWLRLGCQSEKIFKNGKKAKSRFRRK